MTQEGLRVFVVEDEALIAMEIGDRLRGLGYVPCGTSARGEQALEQIPGARPDVVLMDINLAGKLDGIETATRLKEAVDVPVVFLSAFSDDALIARAVATSAGAYLIKPFEARELHATIQAVFYKHRLERTLRGANETLEAEVRARTAALAASEARLKAAQRVARMGDWVADLASGEIDWSEALFDVFGRDAATFRPTLERYYAEIVHPEDRAALQAQLEAAISTGTQRSLDHRSVLPDGSVIWVYVQGTVERDASGRPVRLRGVALDITARKLAEHALHDLNATLEWRVQERTRALVASERFSQGTLDAIGARLAVLDGAGEIVAANLAWRRFTEQGAAWPGGLAGTNYLAACRDVTGERAAVAQVLAEGIGSVIAGVREAFEHEVASSTADGERRFLARVVRFADGGSPLVVLTYDDVTTVHDALRRVEEGERAFASLSLASPVGVFRMDTTGRCTFVNRRCCAMTGLTEEESLGDGWSRTLHAADRERVLVALRDAAKVGGEFREEYRFLRPDGTLVWVLGQTVPIPGTDGDPVGHMGTLTDISDRKLVEQAMWALSSELVALEGESYLEGAMAWLADQLPAEVAFVSRFDPARPDELRTVVLLEEGVRQPNISYAVEGTPCAQVLQGRGCIIAEGVQAKYPDDAYFVVQSAESYAAEPLLDHAGRVLGHVGVISRRPFDDEGRVGTILRMFAVALSAAVVRERDRRQFEDLFEFAPSGLVLSDREGRIVAINRRAEALFGWTAAELRGQPVEMLVPEGQRERHVGLREGFRQRATERQMAAGRPHLQAVRKDGSLLPVEIDLAPVETEAGLMVAASVRDISARLQAEAALDEARRHLIDTIESTSQGMVLYDAADRVAVFNQQFVSFYGGLVDLIHEGTSFETLLRAGVERGIIRCPPGHEERIIAERLALHRSADGTPFVRHLPDGRVVSLADHRSRDGGIITVASDITEMLEQQQRIREMQKMEAIGKLTGGMAHDFNNYLGVIIGNLDLLQDIGSEDPEVAELVESARRGALRAADLTRSLLAFARRQPLDARLTDLRRHIESVSSLLSRSLGEDVSLALDIDTNLWPVRIDVAQLESSLVNLANNARDAMPRGGELRIGARNVHVDDSKAEAMGDVALGDYVRIEVSDTGAGMNAEVLARVFEPFFTTKPAGHGTGLGLSMVYGFVAQSGGIIRVYSEPGHGTVVRMYLPRAIADGDTVGEVVLLPVVAPPRGDETILVVEDNEPIRRTAIAQLESFGYRVLEAENGAVALQLLEARASEVDLVFSDVVMPGRPDGHELVAIVEERYPGIHVLLTSGFPGDAWARAGGAARRRTLLSKPYRKDDLARLVRQVLDRRDQLAGDSA